VLPGGGLLLFDRGGGQLDAIDRGVGTGGLAGEHGHHGVDGPALAVAAEDVGDALVKISPGGQSSEAPDRASASAACDKNSSSRAPNSSMISSSFGPLSAATRSIATDPAPSPRS
jgi:hypothetical protein